MHISFLKYFFAFILCFVIELSIAQLPDLIPYRKGNLWGYCDSNKVVKIEPKFTNVGWFDKYGYGFGSYVDEKINKTVFIDSNGNILDYRLNLMNAGEDLFYFYYENNGEGFIDVKSGRKKYFKNSECKRIFLGIKETNHQFISRIFIKKDSVDVYVEDVGHFVFTDSIIDDIEDVYNDDFLLYAIDSSDKSIEVLNQLNGEIYFVCNSKSGKRYIRHQDGTITFQTKPVFNRKHISGDVFVVQVFDKWYVYNNTGRLLFIHSSSGKVEGFGQSLLKEVKGEATNIINLKGEYVVKKLIGNHVFECEYDYDHYYHPTTYYKIKNCYYIQNAVGTITKVCKNKADTVVWFGKSFIAFRNGLGIDLHSNHTGALLLSLQQWTFGDVIKNNYNKNDYFSYFDNGEKKIIDSIGISTSIPSHTQNLLVLNSGIFIGYSYYSDSCCLTFFNKKGTVLWHHSNILKSSVEQELYKLEWINKYGYDTDNIVFTLKSRDKSDTSNLYFILLMIGDSIVNVDSLLNAQATICNASAAFESFIPWDNGHSDLGALKSFYSCLLCDKPSLSKTKVYYYVDKYGTVYYDE
jgi:hypothetical protein